MPTGALYSDHDRVMPTLAKAPKHHTTDSLPRYRYKHPPVVEALIDIQVELPQGLDTQALTLVRRGEEVRYPVEQQVKAQQLTVDVATGNTTERRSDVHGYRFISATQQEIIQVRRDGFAFSKLPPYTSWEVWREEARRLWEKYRAVAQPTAVTRIAVRYINRVDIPLPVHAIKDYFTTCPEIGPALPQKVSGFIMRLELPQPDMPGAILVLNLGRLPHPAADTASILLDLDLFLEHSVPVDDNVIWPVLEQLHARENELFEGCITDKAREIFNR